jgi:ribonuclease HI
MNELTNPLKIKKKSVIKLVNNDNEKDFKLLDSKIEKYLNKLNKDNNLYIYTDGSVKNNGKKHATGGYGIFYSDYSIKPIYKIMDSKINIITTPLSELSAIITGLKNLDDLKILNKNKYNKIILFTDSEYCYKCLTKWYSGWVKNNWKTAFNKTEVKNKDYIITAYNLVHKLNVELIHINSHTNKDDLHSLGNDIADYLSKCY